MLYVLSSGKEEVKETVTTSVTSESESEIEEDEIDKYLEAQDGWIQRKRDANLYDPKLLIARCKHGAHGRCNWCMPIAPWTIMEQEPWKTEKVPNIPFHSYLRRMLDNAGCKHPPSQK
jgi:hypothetical protein